MKEIKIREEKKYLTKLCSKYQITINIILVMIQEVIVIILKQIKKLYIPMMKKTKKKNQKTSNITNPDLKQKSF